MEVTFASSFFFKNLSIFSIGGGHLMVINTFCLSVKLVIHKRIFPITCFVMAE